MMDNKAVDNPLMALATANTGLRVEDLMTGVRGALPEVCKKQPLVNAVALGVAQLALRIKGGAAFLAFSGASAQPTLEEQVRGMFYGDRRTSAERYGEANVGVPILPLESATGAQRDLGGYLGSLKDLGLSFEDADMVAAATNDPKVGVLRADGLYAEPFVNETGDVKGVDVVRGKAQLEIHGVKGPARPFLRVEAKTLIGLIGTALGIKPTEPVLVQATKAGW